CFDGHQVDANEGHADPGVDDDAFVEYSGEYVNERTATRGSFDGDTVSPLRWCAGLRGHFPPPFRRRSVSATSPRSRSSIFLHRAAAPVPAQPATGAAVGPGSWP